MKFQFTDLGLLHSPDKKKYMSLFEECLDNSAFILGKYVNQLEEDMQNYLNAKYCIGVSSGTDALLVPLMALGIGAGDEVITSPFTFIATAEVIALLGAKPVFVDIEDKTYNIDPEKIEEKITNKTKAIIPVHLYGHPAEMDKIIEIGKKHNIPVIEDAAQAIGSEYNDIKTCNFGICGALSFFPAKNLGCFGDGGMIVTNDKKFAGDCRVIMNHGQRVRYEHEVLGINGRLDNLQAAFLTVKLRKLDKWLDQRNKLARNYIGKFNGIDVITPFIKENCKHVFNQFTLRIKDRDGLQEYLGDNGIPSAIHYPIPLHQQPVFKNLGYKKGDFPVAEKISKDVISIPIFPGMTDEQQNTVVNCVKDFLES